MFISTSPVQNTSVANSKFKFLCSEVLNSTTIESSLSPIPFRKSRDNVCEDYLTTLKAVVICAFTLAAAPMPNV
jgi:hypothetical protein